MKLLKIKSISGEITLRSGLHIGTGDTEMHIGGTDSPIVTHPHTREPYIPGSSIKGKVRSLLEMRTGLMAKTKGKPLSARDLEGLSDQEKKTALSILQLFGTSSADGEAAKQVGQARASFSDCALNDACRKKAYANSWAYTEVKSENSINRIMGVADSPRFIERVVAGLSFDFAISLKKMADDDDDLLGLLLEGLKMLELDALGGSGSRGYGRVKLEFSDTKIQQQFAGISF